VNCLSVSAWPARAGRQQDAARARRRGLGRAPESRRALARGWALGKGLGVRSMLVWIVGPRPNLGLSEDQVFGPKSLHQVGALSLRRLAI